MLLRSISPLKPYSLEQADSIPNDVDVVMKSVRVATVFGVVTVAVREKSAKQDGRGRLGRSTSCYRDRCHRSQHCVGRGRCLRRGTSDERIFRGTKGLCCR